MSNNINAQNLDGKNPVYEQQNISRFMQAPDSLPKYSLNKVLLEKDEFRSSVKAAYKEQALEQEKTSIFKTVLIAILGAGTFAFLLKKKII